MEGACRMHENVDPFQGGGIRSRIGQVQAAPGQTEITGRAARSRKDLDTPSLAQKIHDEPADETASSQDQDPAAASGHHRSPASNGCAARKAR